MASHKKPPFDANGKKSRNPVDVLKDTTTSDEEKLKTLKNLEEDQKALMRADDESMVRTIEPEKEPSQLLATVQKAERVLKVKNPDLQI